jgi:hypothetical protein
MCDKLFLDKIAFGNKEVIFNSGLTLKVDISFEDKHYIAYNETFGIYGFGENREEAINEFKEAFVDFYCDIVEMPERELGQSTIRYKNTLLSFATLRDGF